MPKTITSTPLQRHKAEIDDLAKNYLEHYGCYKKSISLQEDQKLLQDIILPALGCIKVVDVAKNDLETLHKKLKKRPYQANRVLSLLSKMFSLAVSWGWRENNPVPGIQKYQEDKRERGLNEEELNRLWSALDRRSSYIAAYALKFLTLTGARKSEVLQATWDQFDLKKGLWIKPSHLTKQKKEEHLPLSEKAVEVLESAKKLTPQGSLHVFVDPAEGEPLGGIKALWQTVLKEAQLKGAHSRFTPCSRFLSCNV